MDKHHNDAQPDLETFPSNVAHDLNEFMLNIVIFHQAAKQLKFKPSVDVFATADHYQVARYLATKQDAHAAAINAFYVD